VINRDPAGLQRIDERFRGRVRTLSLSAHSVEEEIRVADIVVGPSSCPAAGHHVDHAEDARHMKKGSVIVDGRGPGRMRGDIASDHARRSVFEVEGVIHYCVANMPVPIRGPQPSR